jgi:putative transposase
LREQSLRYGLVVHAYCLMTNHVHLVATPRSEDSLAKAVGRTHWLYTQAINRLHGRSGHLWQNRFHSCPLAHGHYWAAMRYVERNPVRARLCRFAWEYPYSSAAAHALKTGIATSPDHTPKAGDCHSLAVPASGGQLDQKKTGQAAGCQSPFSARGDGVSTGARPAPESDVSDPTGLLDLREWSTLWTGEQWATELLSEDDDRFIDRLRSQTGQ